MMPRLLDRRGNHMPDMVIFIDQFIICPEAKEALNKRSAGDMFPAHH
jgi:hypothetical protein